MGTTIENWNAYIAAIGLEEGGTTGAYYVGAGSGGWEWTWLLISVGLCGLALVMGFGHEKLAYSRAKKK